ncbi:MAG: DHHA1 domain-containing protein, partial [Oscillospiraceae bacterium]
KCKPTILEAEALLGGIMLDTKNFIIKTGIRTFEAAAYLKKMGADTLEVRKLFASSMSSYQKRSRLVSSAEIYKGFAICLADDEIPDVKIVAPQAADELLHISNVEASFVLYEFENAINFSARSMGDVNVQLIMESLGGGGHMTMAGANLYDISIDGARQKLIQAIDIYNQQKQEKEGVIK